MYRRIAEDLQGKIESGEIARGSQLPTEIELRERFDASRNTVRDAIKWLITRGLVETRPGQGTYVVEKIEPFVSTLALATGPDSESNVYASEVQALKKSSIITNPRVEIQQAQGIIASELQIADGSTVVIRHQQRFIDGTAFSLQTSFYPMRFVEQGAVRLIQAQDIEAGAVRYLEETLQVKQIGGHDRITVRAPDAHEAGFFRLPEDGRVSVFEIFRTSYDESGTPLRVTVTTYPADRNQFVVKHGKVPEDMGHPPEPRQHPADELVTEAAQQG
jgi:GntR family transcriptional regulator